MRSGVARRHVLRGGLAGVAVVALSGCDLLDQRTFNPRASRPPKVYIPPPPPGPPPIPPLIDLVGGTPQQEWADPVRDVVKKALAHKPNILFLVQALAPPGADEAATRTVLSHLVSTDAQAVADAIVAAGATPAQVEMSAMPDSTVTEPHIRVYVR
ncbi:hypothetical protein [Acetobacter conturbans]|uniref:hypothetical protein n=1 Tax=Acetobacter conturbans TaxID=1737472 RepID=UPI001F54B8C6|nr:hypothetical protein [Acetobacter conturbans]